MVTVEAGVAVLVIVSVMAAGLWSLAVGVAQVRAVDAARIGARSAARGDEEGRVRSLTEAAGPRGARVQIDSSATAVVVVVERRFTGPGILHKLALTVRGLAVAPRELGTP